MGIDRHRLNTDGRGITTLVGFHGCPLQCRYCLNDLCHKPEGALMTLTPLELYQKVLIDRIYFEATGGGVTFGGGEPALHSDFIVAFKELCGDEWNITLETSLNVPTEHILKLIPVVDDYIIDIKSLKESIYQSYTGLPLEPVIDNLQLLVAHGKASHITVRTPRIPRYNTIFDVRRSISMLRDMGIERIDSFTYITNRKKIKKPDGRVGKRTCNILKRVRRLIAEVNNLYYYPVKCPHETCLTGNCERCELELKRLTSQINAMRRDGLKVTL